MPSHVVQTLVERVAVIHTLTPGVLRTLAARRAYDRVAYHQSSLPHEALAGASPLPLTRLSFADRPETYLAYWRAAYEWTQALFARPDVSPAFRAYADLFDLPGEHAQIALKKTVAHALNQDCKLIFLTEAILGPSNDGRTYLLREPGLVRLLAPCRAAFAAEPRAQGAWRDSLRPAALTCGLGLRILAPAHLSPGRAYRIVFEQVYPTLEDAEFFAFHRYFKKRDDVAYLCTGLDEKLALLKSEGKPAFVHRWGVRGWRVKLRELARLVRLSVRLHCDPLISSVLRLAALNLLHSRLYYESVFNEFRPLLFIKVRADDKSDHPVITAIAERHGARHAGYTCGSYSCFVYFYALLDFHYYGLLGWHLKNERYKEVWPDTILYSVIGPFTVESDEPKPAAPAQDTIGLFLTSSSSTGDFFIGDEFFREFLGCGRDAAIEVGARLLVKEKYYTAERLASIREALDGKVPYELAEVGHCGGHWDEPLPQHFSKKTLVEVLRESRLVLVMTASTTGWEALALNKKVLFVEQPWLEHPLDKHLPWIVVRSREQLLERLRWLWALPQAKYEAMIEPALTRCGKASNGRMVQDFIEGIESDLPPRSGARELSDNEEGEKVVCNGETA